MIAASGYLTLAAARGPHSVTTGDQLGACGHVAQGRRAYRVPGFHGLKRGAVPGGLSARNSRSAAAGVVWGLVQRFVAEMSLKVALLHRVGQRAGIGSRHMAERSYWRGRGKRTAREGEEDGEDGG